MKSYFLCSLLSYLILFTIKIQSGIFKEEQVEELINDIYLSNVKTFESLSESTLQLGFNGYVMKEFGVKDPLVQFGSASLSMLSIFRSMAARYAFIQYNKDPGFSRNFFKALAILFFPTSTLFIFQLLSWTDKSMMSLLGMCQMIAFHPILLTFIGNDKDMRKVCDCLMTIMAMFPPIAELFLEKLRTVHRYLHMIFFISSHLSVFLIVFSFVSHTIH